MNGFFAIDPVLWLPLADKVANSLYLIFAGHQEFEELRSACYVGLLDACRRFDPTRGKAFQHYAWLRMYGAGVDFVRDQTGGKCMSAHLRPRFLPLTDPNIFEERGSPNHTDDRDAVDFALRGCKTARRPDFPTALPGRRDHERDSEADADERAERVKDHLARLAPPAAAARASTKGHNPCPLTCSSSRSPPNP